MHYKNRELEKSLKHAEEKLQYFNELKDALNQSIIVAQDTADKVKSSANKESEMIITSADNQAKETLVEAERKSNAMIADAEAKSTQILAEAIERPSIRGNRRLEEENTCLPSTLKLNA